MKRIITLLLAIVSVLTVLVLPASAGSIAYGAATVAASSLNIRSGPGKEYDRVAAASVGEVVVILERTSEDWYKINYLGTVGYVNTPYLTDILTAENFSAKGVLTGNNVRMRSGPDTSGEVLGTYSAGTEMTVIGINNGWYKVKYDGKTGYLRSDYMEITGRSDGSSSSSSSSSSGATRSSSGYTTTSAPSSKGEEIVQFALQYVGYRYVYGAESPSVGFDCSGLVYYTYNHFGYKLERRASLQCRNNGVTVAKSDLQPGDLVFFSTNGSYATHVGIYIGDGEFVHASTSNTGVIISSLSSAYYTRVWFAGKRIIEG